MSIRRLEKDFDLALAVVDRSGLAPTIEERLSSAQGGRPRKLPVRMLLGALLIAPSARYANAYLTTVHAILAVDLPASYRRREGLTSGMPGTDGESVTLRQVRYLFNQIVKAMDFSQVTGPSDAVERDAREAATISQLNDLVRASLPEDLPAPDLVAIDATALATWSSTVSKRNPDPDARWGHKTPTPSNDSKDVYGYQINAAATAYTPGSKYQSLKAVIAFDFKQANADLAPSTITMLDEHILPFAPDADIVVDRGYSQWAADRWANLLTERGINQHLDLKKDDLKAVADLDHVTATPTGSSKATGVRMFAGWPFAPHTPPELFEIERPARLTQQPLRPGASHEERIRHARLAEQIATFHAQIAALAPYALVPNGRRKANGSRRFFTCTFGLKNATPSQLGRKASAQATITLSKEVLGKHYQPHRWGTREWMAAFARRTAIEGVFGTLKSRSGQGMNRGWIRVLGITATALMTAAALVSYNLQIVRAWARKNDIDADTLYTAPTQDTPRPDDLDANVNPQAPGAPPAA